MGYAMNDVNRRPWTDAENKILIRRWDSVGSIVLISILLERSPSSVQTHASRLGLPRRREQGSNHRRRWTRDDERTLQELVAAEEAKGNRIPITSFARKMNRSVDALAARLIERYGEQELLSRIILPDEDGPSGAVNGTSAAEADVQGDGFQGSTVREARKTNPKAKMRKCLCCTKSFWSEGPQVRICNPCKKTHEDYNWDW